MNRYYLLCFLLGSACGDPPLRAQTGTPAQRKPAASPQREPGLYMRFETSMGAINCKLFEKEAPVTVRTIVGLAVGTKAYVDPRTKQTVRGKRFFDGLTFHRVIPSFMIQGGDPLGTGQGGPEGPGFPFQDEFVPALKFDVPGRLAMANAGPRTNGSQFFITEVPTEHLNNKHTIFGQCENPDVVEAIARVPARENKPVTPVVIKRVVVERVGPAPANPPEGAPARKPRPRAVRPIKKS
jgi:peptidyl-prolyl cis-trans isomerase A (cyclophilin A)